MPPTALPPRGQSAGPYGDIIVVVANAMVARIGVGQESRSSEPSGQGLRQRKRTYQDRPGAPPLWRVAAVRRQRVPEIRRHLGRADARKSSRAAFSEEPPPRTAALDYARALPEPVGDEERGRRLARRAGRDGLLVPSAADPARVERASGGQIAARPPARRLRGRLREPARVYRVRLYPATLSELLVGGFRAPLARPQERRSRSLRGSAHGHSQRTAEDRTRVDGGAARPGGGQRDSGGVLLRA